MIYSRKEGPLTAAESKALARLIYNDAVVERMFSGEPEEMLKILGLDTDEEPSEDELFAAIDSIDPARLNRLIRAWLQLCFAERNDFLERYSMPVAKQHWGADYDDMEMAVETQINDERTELEQQLQSLKNAATATV